MAHAVRQTGLLAPDIGLWGDGADGLEFAGQVALDVVQVLESSAPFVGSGVSCFTKLCRRCREGQAIGQSEDLRSAFLPLHSEVESQLANMVASLTLRYLIPLQDLSTLIATEGGEEKVTLLKKDCQRLADYSYRAMLSALKLYKKGRNPELDLMKILEWAPVYLKGVSNKPLNAGRLSRATPFLQTTAAFFQKVDIEVRGEGRYFSFRKQEGVIPTYRSGIRRDVDVLGPFEENFEVRRALFNKSQSRLTLPQRPVPAPLEEVRGEMGAAASAGSALVDPGHSPEEREISQIIDFLRPSSPGCVIL